MKILQHICHLDSGGAETLVRDLSCELAAKGHTVTVALLDEFRTTEHAIAARTQLQKAGVEVVSLGRRPGQTPIAAAFALARLLRRGRFDVMHTHTPLPDVLGTAAMLLARAETQHVSTIHNSKLNDHGRVWKQTLARRQNVFCSHGAARRNPALARSACVIPNGVRPVSFCNISTEQRPGMRRLVRAQQGIPEDALLLINVGRIALQKNQERLVHTTALLSHNSHRPVHCMIAGRSDTSAPDLAATARRLGIAQLLHLTGPRQDVPALLAAADVYVSTSLWEGMPLAVLEALFSGVPCVLSPLEEHREIAGDAPAVWFAEEDTADAFADAIQQATTAPTDRAAISATRRDRLEPYTIAACAQAYAELYRKGAAGDRT